SRRSAYNRVSGIVGYRVETQSPRQVLTCEVLNDWFLMTSLTISRPRVAWARRLLIWKFSGLRFRMAVSYALTTVAAVLLIEVLAGATLWTVLTQSPIAGTWMTSGAKQIAKVYALAAAAQAGGAALDPRTTFEPGRPGSIALSREYLS